MITSPNGPAVQAPSRPIRILGAGPAGLTAALTIARAGWPVEVFERRTDCGARFRGDLQGLENWTDPLDVTAELGRLGIEVNFLCVPCTSLVETNGRRSERLVFDRPAFYLVKRGMDADSLDQGLKTQARAAGVTIHFGTTLAGAECDIVATGPVVREVFAIAKGIVFHTDAPDLAVGLLADRSGRKGYSYLLVTSGYACLCSALFEDFSSAQACLDEAVRTLTRQFDFRIENPRSVGGIGHVSHRVRFRQGRTSYVGEAAGLQDLLWGFGIRLAVRSGWLAAHCLLEGLDYQREAAARFRGALKAGVVNRFLWESFRWRDYTLILTALKTDAPRKLRWLYRFNPLQRILYPVAHRAMRRRYRSLVL